jgi:hypothetical protein
MSEKTIIVLVEYSTWYEAYKDGLYRASFDKADWTVDQIEKHYFQCEVSLKPWKEGT